MEFLLLKRLICWQKLYRRIKSRLNVSPFLVQMLSVLLRCLKLLFWPEKRQFWQKLNKGFETQNGELLRIDLIFTNNFRLNINIYIYNENSMERIHYKTGQKFIKLSLCTSTDLTRLTWLIHTSFLPSKWNLYLKIQFLA